MSTSDTPMPQERATMLSVVAERAQGSPEAAAHTHIECHCPGHVHRTGRYEEGCFCPNCAVAEAIERGLAARDTEPENVDEPDDTPQWCERCGRLISSAITPDGAGEELSRWETRAPRNAEEWRDFALCVSAIAEEHLPRVARVIASAYACGNGGKS